MNGASHALGDYKVGKRISSGGFGYVFRGGSADGKDLAIKYERTCKRIDRPYLQHEADVYRLLEGDPRVPNIYAYGREDHWNIMVFDLLGTSLETLFEKCGGKFSAKTVLMIAPQIIECIEYCHSKGIIHRDIKPDNFLMGRGDRANLVHIIDFGLARRYRHPRSLKHFPYFTGHSFFGTIRFASLSALEGFSQSRRDDLESAAYTLIYLVRGRLPWQGLRGGTDKHREQRIREKKRTWTPERLCEGLPEDVAEPLAKMLQYVKSLSYEDEPDYIHLKNIFHERFEKAGYELDYDYDWLHLDESDSEFDRSSSRTSLSSKAGERSDDKVSKDSGTGDYADDESDKVASNSPRSLVSKDVPMSSRNEREGRKIGRIASAHSSIAGVSKDKAALRVPNLSRTPTSFARKVHSSGSRASKRALSRSDKSYLSESSDSETSSSSSEDEETPIKKGDIVLIKFLARDTLEKDGVHDQSVSVVDKSYWHQPSLSNDEWHFPYRPALVTKLKTGSTNYLLSVLPIMQRADGLADVSPARRPVFFQISSKNENEANPLSEGQRKLKLDTTPAWPLDGTYVHHQYDNFEVLVPTSAVEDVQVVWSLNKKQLRRLLEARDDVRSVINNEDYLSDAGSETEFVRERQRKRRAYVRHSIYGAIASLTEKAFTRGDVDLKGSNGWSPEFFKTERRRNQENGYYSSDTENYSIDSENVSMWTGRAPSNRRLSCTLATDGDVIVEAASVAGSEHGSGASSRYRSPRRSWSSSHRSETSLHRSKASSRRSVARSHKRKEKKAGSAAPSAAGSLRSLRQVVLDSVARSAANSPTHSHRSFGSGDSPVSSHFSTDSDSVDTSSNAGFVTTSEGSAADNNESGLSPSSSRSNAGSASGSSRSRRSSDASSIAKSIVGSASGSVAALARTVAESLMGLGDGSYNHKASTNEEKIMVDEAVQTGRTDGGDNPESSASKGKTMSDKAVQTEA